MDGKPLSKLCWMCGYVVTLEDCKIDEHGMAVHENCYVARVLLEQHRHWQNHPTADDSWGQRRAS